MGAEKKESKKKKAPARFLKDDGSKAKKDTHRQPHLPHTRPSPVK